MSQLPPPPGGGLRPHPSFRAGRSRGQVLHQELWPTSSSGGPGSAKAAWQLSRLAGLPPALNPRTARPRAFIQDKTELSASYSDLPLSHVLAERRGWGITSPR